MSASISSRGRLALACVLSVSLQGCESVNQVVAQATTSATAAMAPSTSATASSNASATPGIASTELAGIFKRYPLGAPQSRDNYPRAAITITSATPSLFQLGRAKADQCILFNVRLWSDAKTSRSFDGLQMSAKDSSFNVPFRTLTYWPNTYVTWETTGAVRTDGPKRPKSNFLTETKVSTAWFNINSQAFF
jgi:hypothetical protein